MSVPTSRIPASYQPAGWRNTLPVDVATQRLGVGFTLASGEVVRLSLDVVDARGMAESVLDYLSSSQSPISSGIPSDAVSYPPEGECA